MRRIVILLAAAPLVAHSLYFIPGKFRMAAGDTLVCSIHNGDSFPAGEAAPPLQRLRDGRLVSGETVVPLTGFRVIGKAAQATIRVPAPGSWWLVVRTLPNFLSLEPAKFESYLKTEGLDQALRHRATHGESAKASREIYSKYAKSLIVAGAPSAAWSQTLGLTIEFVPEKDPAAVSPGDFLPVRLLWRGRPAAGVQVESAWSSAGRKAIHNVSGRTDAEGRILVPIGQAGVWRLHAVAIERAADATTADWESFWASLTFEVVEPRMVK